jgi:Antitoxin-like ribbon-helix-helix
LATRGSTKKKAKAVKPSRIGRVQLSSYQAPEAVRQLKILAAKEGSTIQALTAEGLNLLFAKYGKPTIATS